MNQQAQAHRPARRLSRRLPRRQTGVTLVESLVCLAVASVALGAAAPGFKGAVERRHLEGTAAQLETDLQHVRGLAVAQNRSLRISFDNRAGASCYVVHTGRADDCRCNGNAAPVCVAGTKVYRMVTFGTGSPVGVLSNVRSIVFDPFQGTSSPAGTLRVTAPSGAAIHQVVSIMGRVRSCSPAPGVAGYPAC